MQTTLTPQIHQMETLTQKKVTSKSRPQKKMILKNTSNGSNSVPYEKVHKSVNHDITEKDNVKKDMKTQLKTIPFHQLLLIGYKIQKICNHGSPKLQFPKQ